MKKILSFALLLVVALPLISFAQVAGVPTVSVSGLSLTWAPVSGATGYLVSEIRGSTPTYYFTSSTFYTPRVFPGETMKYVVSIQPNNNKWSNEVSITFPATATPTSVPTSGSSSTSNPATSTTTTTTPVAPTTCTTTISLKLGSSGEEVIALQQKLVSLGILIMPTNTDYGYFGPLTFTAVKTFQTSKGLTADGIVGAKTKEALGLQNCSGALTQVAGCEPGNLFNTVTGASCSTTTASPVVTASTLSIDASVLPPAPATFTTIDPRTKEIQEKVSVGGIKVTSLGTYDSTIRMQGPKVVYATQPFEFKIFVGNNQITHTAYNGYEGCVMSGQGINDNWNYTVAPAFAFGGPVRPGDYVYTYSCTYRDPRFPYASPTKQSLSMTVTSIPLPVGAKDYADAVKYYFALDYPTSTTPPLQYKDSDLTVNSYTTTAQLNVNPLSTEAVTSVSHNIADIERFEKMNLSGPAQVTANSSAMYSATAAWTGDGKSLLSMYDRNPLQGISYGYSIKMYDDSVNKALGRYDTGTVSNLWDLTDILKSGGVLNASSPQSVSIKFPFLTLNNPYFKKAMWRSLVKVAEEQFLAPESEEDVRDPKEFYVEKPDGLELHFYSDKEEDYQTVLLPYPSSNKFSVCLGFSVNYWLKQNLNLKYITSDMMGRSSSTSQCKMITMQ